MKILRLMIWSVRVIILPFLIFCLIIHVFYCYWLAGQSIPASSFWKRRLMINIVWTLLFIYIELVLIKKKRDK